MITKLLSQVLKTRSFPPLESAGSYQIQLITFYDKLPPSSRITLNEYGMKLFNPLLWLMEIR